MPEQRRPSPIQPPFQTDTHYRMAQVQHAPSWPLPTFLGRPEPRSLSGTTLPPIQTTRFPVTTQYGARGANPSLQLPPLRPPPASTRDQTKAISIAELVTSDAPSPPIPSFTPQSSYSSPDRGPGGTPTDPTATLHPHHASYHRLDHPPSAHHPPAFAHPGRKPQYPYSIEQPVRRQQYSPAVASESSESYFDSPSEVSPRTSIVPGRAFTSTPQVSQPPPFKYTLLIRQQPAAARACGFGERDRRVIDPPPILELKVTDRETGKPAQDHNGMLALHCTLLSPDSEENQTEVPPAHPDMPATRRLMGTLITSQYQAKDEHGVGGNFFVFPDLSCRSPGKYRLRFKLLRIDPQTIMLPGAKQPAVALAMSDVFSVFTAKDFPGMRASSALLKSLRRQGLNVGVKKGSEARKGKGKAKKESSSGEDDEDSGASDDERRGSAETAATASTGSVSPRTRTKSKPKRKRRDT